MSDLETNQNTESFNFIPREIKTNVVRVLEHGIDKEITYKQFQKDHGAFGIIRITHNEFDYLEEKEFTNLTHFNLQVSSHKKGEKYLLIKILKHGHLDNNTNSEELPLLDISNPQLYECEGCIENVTYAQLEKMENIFKNSFPDIQSIEDLKKVIVERYSSSMSYLTKEEILELGISITKLKKLPLEKMEQ